MVPTLTGAPRAVVEEMRRGKRLAASMRRWDSARHRRNTVETGARGMRMRAGMRSGGFFTKRG